MRKNVNDFFEAIGFEDMESWENVVAQVSIGILIATVFVVVLCLGSIFD